MKNEKRTSEKCQAEEISRRDALKKVGKYTAVTALGTFLILNPKKAQAMSSPPPDPGSGGF